MIKDTMKDFFQMQLPADVRTAMTTAFGFNS